MTNLHDGRLIGIGLYTPPEAARLTGAKPRSITGWLRGYERRGVAHEPLWTPEPETRSDVLTLSFQDLLQLRTVTAFQKRGLSTRFIRRAILRA
jgi:hypothetical protein